MKCPECSGKSKVIDTRYNAEYGETYRRLECQECGKKYFTLEIVADEDEQFLEQWRSTARAIWTEQYQKRPRIRKYRRYRDYDKD